MSKTMYTDTTAREESAAAAAAITPTDKVAHMAALFMARQAELKAAKGSPVLASVASTTPKELIGVRAPVGKLDGRQ